MSNSKSVEKKPKNWNQKVAKFLGWIFFGNGKKTKKLQKCNFATLQLFGLIAFYYCFLIKKGKKQQKLQSCIFATFWFFFPKISGPKNSGFLWDLFFESQKFGFQKPYPYFFGAWIPTVFMSETLSLFFGVGIDLNSFYFINLIPIFLGGLDLNSFFVQKPYPYLLFGGDGSQQFSFQKPYPYFFCQVFISTVFISETFFLFSKIKTVEMKTLQKNREKVSEIKTVEMKTLQTIGRRFLK